MKFPKHITLSIDHNNHKNYYQTINEYFKDNDFFLNCISEEDLKICLEKNELWEIQFYPHTPSSFHKVISYSLERCLDIANSIE